MQRYAVLVLLLAVALSPCVKGKSSLIGISGDDTRHGIEVVYGEFAGNQVQVVRYHVDTLIQTRFARTEIQIEVRNNGAAENITIPFAIPESAMLVNFEIDDSNGMVHQARPMMRNDLAIESTQTTSKIQARNAEAFDVDVELGAGRSVVFRVAYEELLTRQRGVYTNVQQVWPGAVVEDLKLTVRIRETSSINNVNYTFTTETANSVVSVSVDDLVSAANRSASEFALTLRPTAAEQRALAGRLALGAEGGLGGQLRVEYDVARYPTAGDIVVRDGYFAHFFAPSELRAIPKYALFLLDVSGSMTGRKIEQLRDAMVTILGQLGPDDIFTVIEFSNGNTMWRLGDLPSDSSTSNPFPAPVVQGCNAYTSAYIPLAQERAQSMNANGGTAMLGGLMDVLDCAKSTPAGLEPILVMLTDGVPNEPIDQIQAATTTANNAGNGGDLVTSIFTLALGNDCNAAFLRELALRNGGKFQQIYEAADASVELSKFYEGISSPLLTDVAVTFDYKQAVQSTVTQKDFRTYFWGSELVVAGRIVGDTLSGVVTATGVGGQNVTYPIQVTAQPSWQPQTLGGQANSERLWAFLYTKQQLDEEVLDGPQSAAANASIDMALLYSYVTPHTCLAVDIVNPYQAPTTPTTSSPLSTASAMTTTPTTLHPSPTGTPSPPGPPSPPTGPPVPADGARNSISIGSISVGSMTVNGPLIQFNLR